MYVVFMGRCISLFQEIKLLKTEVDAIDSALSDTRELLQLWKGRLTVAMKEEAKVLLDFKSNESGNRAGEDS